VVRSHPLEWGILLAIPIVGASIVTAHVVELGLERPSIALGHRLTRFSMRPAPKGQVDRRAASVEKNFFAENFTEVQTKGDRAMIDHFRLALTFLSALGCG